MKATDGRRIIIAWMQAWRVIPRGFLPEGGEIFWPMTVPRELSLKNGKLIQKPVRELENFRGEKIIHENVKVSEETSLEGVSGRVLDMTVTLKAEEQL